MPLLLGKHFTHHTKVINSTPTPHITTPRSQNSSTWNLRFLVIIDHGMRKLKSHISIDRVQGWQFCPTPLNPPLPASPRAGFPRPTKVVGRGWGKILDPHHGAGRGWVYTFQTHPAPSLSRGIVLLNIQIILFSFC